MTWHWMNGDAKASTLNVFHPAVLYGRLAFTTFRAWEGRVLGLDLHLERLHRACPLIGIESSQGIQELVERALSDLSKARGATWQAVRIAIWAEDRSLQLAVSASPLDVESYERLRNQGVNLAWINGE